MQRSLGPNVVEYYGKKYIITIVSNINNKLANRFVISINTLYIL